MSYELTQVAQTQTTATVAAETAKAAEEIQAALVIAKRFPRDENAAYNKIITACKRKRLAQGAMYAYPRGGQMVTGPSIRLAEVLAQAWGNVDFGIKELSQENGESEVLAYCWDLETNTRQTKLFKVPHKRFTKRGVQTLTDSRDIYELIANQGARRLRACILGVIPSDIVDEAVDQCDKTVQGATSEPIADRIKKMVVAFGEIGVTKEMIEKRLGHKIDVTIDLELAGLIKIFNSIKDGMTDRATWFEFEKPKTSDDTKQLTNKLLEKEGEK